MRLWADVTNASGTRLGPGPIVAAQTATINRVMDGPGRWVLNLPAGEQRHVDLLVEGRFVTLFGEVGGVTRTLGGGRLTDRTLSDASSGATLIVKGLNQLDDLKFYNTLPNRRYDDETIADVVDDLVTLAGWTADIDAGLGNTTQLFNGISVLKALRTVAQQHGLHFRLDGDQNIVFGALGDDTGLRLIQRDRVRAEMYSNPNIALIANIKEQQSRDDVTNWILPLGKKDSDYARVTLEYSTRTAPYTIQSMTGPDGSTLYYLSDASSIATYGTRQAVPVYESIESASGGAGDLEDAANALYDAAAAELSRKSVTQVTYSLRLVNVQQTIEAGDKVRVVYQGYVERDGRIVRYLDTDALYWVLDVNETLGATGHSVSIRVSNVDQVAMTAAETVAETVSTVENLQK